MSDRNRMTFDEDVKMLGLKLTPRQKAACRGLEAQGKRFCIDFGTRNAVAMWKAVNTLKLTREDKKFLSDCGIPCR
jgi:hypothetical protein